MHTPYELQELFICESFWPVGERAANERAVMQAMLIASSMAGSDTASKEAFFTYECLMGQADPDKILKRNQPKTDEQKAKDVKAFLKTLAGG